MNKDPIQFESGELGCPICKVVLVSGKVEMFYPEKSLGYFDGLKCKLCNYGLLTEKGYDNFYNVVEFGTQSTCNDVDITNFGYFISKGSTINVDNSDIRFLFNQKINK